MHRLPAPSWKLARQRPEVSSSLSSLPCFLTAESTSIRRVPESRRPFGQRDNSIESHSGNRRECYLSPYHVKRHAGHLDGNAKSDPVKRRAEKLRHDGPDQR